MNETEQRLPNCPICGSAALPMSAQQNLSWRYWQCPRCDHAFLHPVPDLAELAKYYNSAYKVPVSWYEDGVPAVHRLISSLLPSTRGTLLEIGCSYGSLLARLRNEGWTVEGVEIDERAATHAQAHLGLQVHVGSLEASAHKLHHPSFDVIMMHHVLEHVREPHAFTRHLSSLLKPGGRLIIRTPNARSAAMKLEKGWWEWSAPPEHVHLYSPASIARLFGEHAIRCDLVRTRRGDARGMFFEMLSYLNRRFRALRAGDHREGSAAVAVEVSSLMNRGWFRPLRRTIDTLSAPVDYVLSKWRLGPELLVVAAKE